VPAFDLLCIWSLSVVGLVGGQVWFERLGLNVDVPDLVIITPGNVISINSCPLGRPEEEGVLSLGAVPLGNTAGPLHLDLLGVRGEVLGAASGSAEENVTLHDVIVRSPLDHDISVVHHAGVLPQDADHGASLSGPGGASLHLLGCALGGGG